MTSGWTSTPNFQLFTTSHIHVDERGRFTTATAPLALTNIQPYIDEFNHVVIHGRINNQPHGAMPFDVTHPRVSVKPIPPYSGISQFVRELPKIRAAIQSSITSPQDHVGVWLPSPIAGIVTKQAQRIGAPLLTTLVGDGGNVAYGMVPEPFKTVGAYLSQQRVRRANHRADATIYVTLETLQRIYPPNPQAITLSRTNLWLDPDVFDHELRQVDVETTRPIKLAAVGSQQQNYKGHDLLLQAVAQLQQTGFNCSLTVVGSGALHQSLIDLGHELGVENLTMLPSVGNSSDVMRFLRNQDLFIMPSRTEGMPKALLEAMAVGTLSLGSRVGGIPELLTPPCLFEPESVTGIVEAVRRVTADNDQFSELRVQQRAKALQVHTNHSGAQILREFLSRWKTKGSHGGT